MTTLACTPGGPDPPPLSEPCWGMQTTVESEALDPHKGTEHRPADKFWRPPKTLQDAANPAI